MGSNPSQTTRQHDKKWKHFTFSDHSGSAVCAGVVVTFLYLDLFLFSRDIGGIHVRNRVLWKFKVKILQ